MARSGRAAVGRLTFHNREYLAAIRPYEDVLALHTMRFADELVGGDELEVSQPGGKLDDREVEMAGRLVESLHEDFDPGAHRDEYRELVMKAIEAKAEGKDLPTQAGEAECRDDLLAALQASVERG